MLQRLETLKNEFEIEQAKLSALEKQQMSLRETLLRISRAIQVLEELISAENTEAEKAMAVGS